MRCINGLIPEAYHGEMTGDILLYGESVRGKKLSDISQHVGTLLQDPERQILGTYVLNEVCFGLECLGLERSEMIRRGEEALRRLNILHLRDKETFGTSGGEKQKVALAGVLAMQPKILLLDEPLASLDPASAREALLAFRQLADEGLAVMIVEHRVEDVLAIHPERVIYMEDGEITYQGSPAGLSQVVDYHKIKLPAEDILARAKKEPEADFVPAVPKLDYSKPLLQFNEVGFHYHEDLPEVLHGINLNIYTGEVIAILGHNGSGKTTLVKHALGLLKPTASCAAEGMNPINNSGQSRPHCRLRLPKPDADAFCRNCRRRTFFWTAKTWAFQKKPSRKMCVGQFNLCTRGRVGHPTAGAFFWSAKRVSIASVLSMRSRILMMDEPTAGQDYWNYQSFMDTILQMPGFDSIIFITHDLDLALTYANRIIVLFDGEIVADGAPQDVLQDTDRLLQWRLLPTSLLELNFRMLPRTGKFQRAEALARYVG